MPTSRSRRALSASCIGMVAAVSALAAAGPAGATPPPPSVEPQLVTSVDVSSGARFLLGDVSGDGRLDLVTQSS
jgi:hypothetical protein